MKNAISNFLFGLLLVFNSMLLSQKQAPSGKDTKKRKDSNETCKKYNSYGNASKRINTLLEEEE